MTSTFLTDRIRRIIIAFTVLVVVSVAGYMLIEGYSFIDALYMTIISLSTVGFGEVRPLTPLGRAFTIGVILTGVGAGAYLLGTAAEYIIAGELEGTLKQRRLLRTITKMEKHYIVCGFGRVGRQVATELLELKHPFIVIDLSPAVAAACQERGIPVLIGDATDDDTLRMAGIERARGLVAVLNTDAANVFVVLSARSLNRDLVIVSRATNEDAEHKLLKAGADRVVSPYVMAGHRIAGLLTRPNVVSFRDRALLHQELEFWLEEILVSSEGSLIGQTVTDAAIPSRTGANLLAIIRPREKRALVDWSPQLRLEPNDVIIVLGSREQLEAVARLAGDARHFT